jgi:hypothetical protein
VDAFDTWVGGWAEVGIDEIALYFPPEALWPADVVDPEVLDHVRDLLAAA